MCQIIVKISYLPSLGFSDLSLNLLETQYGKKHLCIFQTSLYFSCPRILKRSKEKVSAYHLNHAFEHHTNEYTEKPPISKDVFCSLLLTLCFKMYPGFCFHSGMVRPTDQEMIAIENIICYSDLLRGRGSCHTGPHEEAPG